MSRSSHCSAHDGSTPEGRSWCTPGASFRASGDCRGRLGQRSSVLSTLRTDELFGSCAFQWLPAAGFEKASKTGSKESSHRPAAVSTLLAARRGSVRKVCKASDEAASQPGGSPVSCNGHWSRAWLAVTSGAIQTVARPAQSFFAPTARTEHLAAASSTWANTARREAWLIARAALYLDGQLQPPVTQASRRPVRRCLLLCGGVQPSSRAVAIRVAAHSSCAMDGRW